jgi:hypothetical protein
LGSVPDAAQVSGSIWDDLQCCITSGACSWDDAHSLYSIELILWAEFSGKEKTLPGKLLYIYYVHLVYDNSSPPKRVKVS